MIKSTLHSGCDKCYDFIVSCVDVPFEGQVAGNVSRPNEITGVSALGSSYPDGPALFIVLLGCQSLFAAKASLPTKFPSCNASRIVQGTNEIASQGSSYTKIKCAFHRGASEACSSSPDHTHAFCLAQVTYLFGNEHYVVISLCISRYFEDEREHKERLQLSRSEEHSTHIEDRVHHEAQARLEELIVRLRSTELMEYSLIKLAISSELD